MGATSSQPVFHNAGNPYVSAAYQPGDQSGDQSGENTPLVSAALNAPFGLTPLADAMTRLKIQRLSEASNKVKWAARGLSLLMGAGWAGLLSFGPQVIEAAHYATLHFPWMPFALVRYGFWFGVSLFSSLNSLAMSHFLLGKCLVWRHGAKQEVQDIKNSSKSVKALTVFSVIYNVAMFGLGAASIYAATAGVQDAYAYLQPLLAENDYFVPKWVGLMATAFSAFGTNMLFMFTRGFFGGMMNTVFHLSQYTMPCCRAARYRGGFEFKANRTRHCVPARFHSGREAMYHLGRAFDEMQDKNLGKAIEGPVEVYKQVRLDSEKKQNFSEKLQNKATVDDADIDRLYEHYAVYCSMREIDENGRKYLPGRKSTGAWSFFGVVSGITVGLAGSLMNFIAGLDAGGRSGAGASLAVSGLILALGSFIANALINVMAAVMLPKLIYNLLIKPFFLLCCHGQYGKDALRSPATLFGEWFLNVFVTAIAAVPAFSTFGGDYGLTLEMMSNVSILQGLPSFLGAFLSITPAAALASLVLYAVVNKLAELVKTFVRERVYQNTIGKSFAPDPTRANNASLHGTIKGSRFPSVAAKEACAQFKGARGRYERFVGAMPSGEFNEHATFFAEFYRENPPGQTPAGLNDSVRSDEACVDIGEQKPAAPVARAHRFFAPKVNGDRGLPSSASGASIVIAPDSPVVAAV